MSQALTAMSPEQQEFYQKEVAKNQKSFTPRIPEIKLAQQDTSGVKAGEYYTQEYDSVKKEKVFKNIGKNPHIVILKKAATYSYYDEKSKTLVAWTSDIEGYSEYHNVILFKNGEKPFIEFKGSYPEFKAYSLKNYTVTNTVTNNVEKLLSFKTVLYVLFNEKVYRMFVPNTGVAGVADGEKTGDFKNPQVLSLTHFLDSSSDMSSEAQSGAIFDTVCEMDSKLIPSTVDFWIMQFKNTEIKPDKVSVVSTCMQLTEDLKNLLREDIQRMGGLPRQRKTDEEIIGQIQGDERGDVPQDTETYGDHIL